MKTRTELLDELTNLVEEFLESSDEELITTARNLSKDCSCPSCKKIREITVSLYQYEEPTK